MSLMLCLNRQDCKGVDTAHSCGGMHAISIEDGSRCCHLSAAPVPLQMACALKCARMLALVMCHGAVQLVTGLRSEAGTMGACLCNGIQVLQDEGRVGHAHAQHSAPIARQHVHQLPQQRGQAAAQVAPVRARVLAAQPDFPHLRLCTQACAIKVLYCWQASTQTLGSAPALPKTRPSHYNSWQPCTSAGVQYDGHSQANCAAPMCCVSYWITVLAPTRRSPGTHRAQSSQIRLKRTHQGVGDGMGGARDERTRLVAAQGSACVLRLAISTCTQAARRQRQDLDVRVAPHLHAGSLLRSCAGISSNGIPRFNAE